MTFELDFFLKPGIIIDVSFNLYNDIFWNCNYSSLIIDSLHRCVMKPGNYYG